MHAQNMHNVYNASNADLFSRLISCHRFSRLVFFLTKISGQKLSVNYPNPHFSSGLFFVSSTLADIILCLFIQMLQWIDL